MDNTYELTRKKNKYKNMRENVIKMINVLSRSEVIDNLSIAQTSLKNHYLVNGSPCKYEEIRKQKERISNCLLVLRNILNSIDLKLNSIKKSIEIAESENNG